MVLLRVLVVFFVGLVVILFAQPALAAEIMYTLHGRGDT